MYWCIIDKSNTPQPTTGHYRAWKDILRAEGNARCVYCAIPDQRLGGSHFFHVEHFRPRSKFPNLEDTISNLFYACPVCNILKSDDWIEATMKDDVTVCYPDPSVVDYSNILQVRSAALVEGRNAAGRYLVERLGLNRGQLITDRKFDLLLFRIEVVTTEYQSVQSQLFDRIQNGDTACARALQGMITAFESLKATESRYHAASPASGTEWQRPSAN